MPVLLKLILFLGHICCITECGRAEEEPKCPECGARIGGASHRLRGGATRSAYDMADVGDTELGRDSTELVRIIEREMTGLFNWIAANAKSPSGQMVEEFGYEWRRIIVFTQLVELLLTVTDRRIDVSLLRY